METRNRTTEVRLKVEEVIGKKYNKLHNDLRSNGVRRLKFSNCKVTDEQVELLNSQVLKSVNARARKHVSDTAALSIESLVVTFIPDRENQSTIS